jgi:hypothetical protein
METVMKTLTLNEVIFAQLMSMDLPGIELVPAAQRVMPSILDLSGYADRVVTPEFLTNKILELYEYRSTILLRMYAMNNGFNPMGLMQFRAKLFRNHFLTYVRVDSTRLGKWDLEDCITNLPWFEPYLIMGTEKQRRFTHDDVLDMHFLNEFTENVTKKEVDDVVSFLNGVGR